VIIGIISDTHGLVRPEITDVFKDVDLILHAGDVGGRGVLEALQKIAAVEAVFGNVDDPHDPALARERVVTASGLTIHVSHGDELGRPTAQLALARYTGDVVVFGHTHRPVTYIAPDGRVAVNPGAAGPRRFDLKPSVARLTLPLQIQIISLA
jgi:putative phosphoesterase